MKAIEQVVESPQAQPNPEKRPPETKTGTLAKKAKSQMHKPLAPPPIVDTPEGTIEQNIEEAAP